MELDIGGSYWSWELWFRVAETRIDRRNDLGIADGGAVCVRRRGSACAADGDLRVACGSGDGDEPGWGLAPAPASSALRGERL